MEFVEACKNSNFELIKELFEKGVDIHYNNEQGFVYLCENGELEMAKWLYEHGKIDIHAKYEWALKNACYFGRLEVAKWLVSIGAKLNSYLMIKHALNNEQFAIIKWLYSIGTEIGGYDVFSYITDEYGLRNIDLNILNWCISIKIKTTKILKINDLLSCNLSDYIIRERTYDFYLTQVFKIDKDDLFLYKNHLEEKENYEYFYIFFLHSLTNNPLLEVNLITTIKEFLFY